MSDRPLPTGENDATCPRCGRHRPNGCLCHIPIPKSYTREDMARAWDEGRAAERRDWEFTADLVTPDEDRQSWPNPYRVIPPGKADR